jgi:hypothetical protein
MEHRERAQSGILHFLPVAVGLLGGSLDFFDGPYPLRRCRDHVQIGVNLHVGLDLAHEPDVILDLDGLAFGPGRESTAVEKYLNARFKHRRPLRRHR